MRAWAFSGLHTFCEPNIILEVLHEELFHNALIGRFHHLRNLRLFSGERRHAAARVHYHEASEKTAFQQVRLGKEFVQTVRLPTNTEPVRSSPGGARSGASGRFFRTRRL